jgi:carbonic anhydrase/acetyltransferase-like protein (isoleucine patch superfamily)
MTLYRLNERVPQVAASAWVAPSAQVMGRVELAEDASIWFGAILRGDNELIRIGRGSNIQDGCVLHTDHGWPLTVGEYVTVGHQATLHSCTVEDGALIGMQAVVLNGVRIGANCLVGAGSLVTEGSEFEPGSLIVGSPAKVVRMLTPVQIERMRQGAMHYVANAQRFRAGLEAI